MRLVADGGRGEGVAGAAVEGDGAPEAHRFYGRQSRITDPGVHVARLDDLPRDVPSLCRVVRGLVVHPATAHLYGVRIPEERLGEQDTRHVGAILARILELDGAPLATPRPPERRFVGCCRDFSTLLCALLRHQGMPARARAGVARYFFPGFGVDHWVCEYWQQGEQAAGGAGGRWVLVDAELDEVHSAAYGIAFDPHDVPRDAFLVAGEAWRRCRAGEAHPESFGVAPDSPVRGWRYLQSQLVRDAASFNRVELLCWDVWGLAHATEETTDPKDLALLDHLAALTLSDDSRFGELRRLYEFLTAAARATGSHQLLRRRRLAHAAGGVAMDGVAIDGADTPRGTTPKGTTPKGTTPKGTTPKGTGFLLCESLVDGELPSNLLGLRVTEESVIDATDAADWQPREWHGVAFEVDLGAADEGAAAEALRRAMRPRWYQNFDTPTTRYVIFSDRVFKEPRSDAAALRSASEAAKAHGRALGIPETQLDGC